MAVWHHIHMDGEYDFSDERVNTIAQFIAVCSNPKKVMHMAGEC